MELENRDISTIQSYPADIMATGLQKVVCLLTVRAPSIWCSVDIAVAVNS